MSFGSKLSRVPRAHDRERGAEVASLFADLRPELIELLAGAGGSSPYLRGLMTKEDAWLRGALHAAPEKVLAPIFEDLQSVSLPELGSALRRAKGKVALFTALSDLGGVWTLEQVTGALTDFADLAVDLAAKALVRQQIERGKLPGLGADDAASAGGYFALAMGKMGAHELNYSSDIDLICLFDETRFEPDDFAEARSVFVRITRTLTSLLSELTGEGYVFRTDLRLRPDPSVTPVCLASEAAERYYESLGRTWERAAYIKARPCAGDVVAGQAFLDRLTPFVWRRHLDFAAIDDAHNMRLRIREHKGLLQKITLEGHDMKLGSGGIREIEFFTQTRQIIAGGRDPSLRDRGTLPAMRALAAKDWIPQDTSETLADAYVAHREVEHRLQMIADAQTHALPKDGTGFDRLAALMGQDTATLRQDLAGRLAQVADITEGFFKPKASRETAVALEPGIAETIEQWRKYPALRSARAIEIFERLRPDLIERLYQATKPSEAVSEFDSFLAGLPAGVQLFSLFEANPHLIDLIVDICATAPGLARFLGRNSAVLDAVIGGGFFSDWPSQSALVNSAAHILSQHCDYEGKLDAIRRWQKELHFRIGVHFLRGLIDAQEASAQYGQLAEAVVVALFPAVCEEFATKHGTAPGRGAAILAMGSLGSGTLSATSDLDLILIYDALDVTSSDGRRPLATQAYFARLTQALVTALSAPTAAGRLYEVDMRLRPSGRQGPVATAISSFENYQKSEAWTWEHLALTRARPIAGPDDLKRDLSVIIREVLAKPRDRAAVFGDVADMRARLADAKPSQFDLDVKAGPGGMTDIELMAQTGALLAGSDVQDTLKQLNSMPADWAANGADAGELAAAHSFLGTIQQVMRLLDGDAVGLDDLGAGGLELMLRATGADDAAQLQKKLENTVGNVGQMISNVLGKP